MAVQISGNDITVPRDGSFTRNVTIGGTLTYEDVTNIDSVGLVTARNGIEIGARPGVAASISVDGNMIVSGISTLGDHLKFDTTGKGIIFGADGGSNRPSIIGNYTSSSDNNMVFNVTGSERTRIDSGGRLLVGTTSARVVGNITSQMQLEGLDASSGISITRNSDNSSSPYISFAKSRSGSVGGNTVVQINDGIGTILFSGADGTDITNNAASIGAFIDATPGGNDTPGRLVFSTSADGGVAPIERLRIDSSGRLFLNTTTEGNAGADDFTIGQLSGSTGITIRSGTTNNGNLYFSDGTSGDDEYRGSIQYQHANDSLHIATNSVESMVIKSNQSICMGGTLQAGANGGVNIESTSNGNKPVGLSLINQGTADDSGFTISYRGKDDAGNQEDFAYLKFTAQDTANGAEDGNLEIWTAKGGTLTKSVQIGPGKPNGEPSMFVIMDSNASGASSEECLRLTNLSNTAYNWCTVSFAVNNSVQWKVGAQRHGAGNGADLLFINNGNDRFRIYENGKLRSQQTYSGTTTGGGPVYVESDGDLLRYTSSRKYKTDIETLEDARADKILDCRPVWYRSLSENDIKTPGSDKSDWGWYGFIAEEVAEIEPRLVNWATKDAGTNPDDGFASVERDPSNYTAEGVRYDNFVPLLVNLVKRQKVEIESLKARLDAAGL